MDAFSQGDATLALGWRMYKPFGLFILLDPVDHNPPSHKFGKCTLVAHRHQKTLDHPIIFPYKIKSSG